jgi:hypothetical protein
MLPGDGGIVFMDSAEIITFPSHRRRLRARARQIPSPSKPRAYRPIQLGPRRRRGELAEPRELGKRYRQLAEQCYRLGAIASESDVSAGFMRMGDDFAAKADCLEGAGR